MPDGARLTAGICLAVIAFVLTTQIIPLFPEDTDFGYFLYVNLLVGFLSGWVIMGKRAGKGFTGAINNGITGVIVMMFWGLFVQGLYEMGRLALRQRFDNPFDALASIFTIGLDYGTTIFVPEILITLGVGAVIAGLATEFAWRTWR